MPLWTLNCADGVARQFEVTHYVTDRYNVVLSFAITYAKGADIITLAPKHRVLEVNKAVKNAIAVVTDGGGAVAGYRVGSAAGLIGALTGAAVGAVVGAVADHVIEEFFSSREIADGDYYGSDHLLMFKGLIRTKS